MLKTADTKRHVDILDRWKSPGYDVHARKEKNSAATHGGKSPNFVAD